MPARAASEQALSSSLEARTRPWHSDHEISQTIPYLSSGLGVKAVLFICVLVVEVVCLPEGVARRLWMIRRRLAGWGFGGFGSVDALPYLGPRPRAVAAGDLMVDRSFRWSDCGRSVFRGPPRGAWVPRSLLELAACFERIGDGWA